MTKLMDERNAPRPTEPGEYVSADELTRFGLDVVQVWARGEEGWSSNGTPYILLDRIPADLIPLPTRAVMHVCDGESTPAGTCCGNDDCESRVHVHGCYADIDGLACDDAGAHA